MSVNDHNWGILTPWDVIIKWKIIWSHQLTVPFQLWSLSKLHMAVKYYVTWPWLVSSWWLPHWFFLSEARCEGHNENHVVIGCYKHNNCVLVAKHPNCNPVIIGTLQCPQQGLATGVLIQHCCNFRGSLNRLVTTRRQSVIRFCNK